ncbi:uncharacterized protein AMSG_06453 [Thecamonas trahens ATCC 50062]|uniref:Uncharacterized protein n=1 Tax=Thecamonas trahens ATCC 50062 TaxID=461836 RepID=A0A0L0DIG3_THETB|nr:hypothetical protein AMSG_06453 [Thecamonas trahens ATCC 50062]KNC51108.1 hypothetical protein AMSG_06453 [Thecamonas trahens ATCC 50062]|eukprot:XP_013756316.1 hypothetical protein AMSG_06453 [Thecamonas trahens ATCC 50062]
MEWLENEEYVRLLRFAVEGMSGLVELDSAPAFPEEFAGRPVVVRDVECRRFHGRKPFPDSVPWKSPRGWRQLRAIKELDVRVQYRSRADGAFKLRRYRLGTDDSLVILHVAAVLPAGMTEFAALRTSVASTGLLPHGQPPLLPTSVFLAPFAPLEALALHGRAATASEPLLRSPRATLDDGTSCPLSSKPYSCSASAMDVELSKTTDDALSVGCNGPSLDLDAMHLLSNRYDFDPLDSLGPSPMASFGSHLGGLGSLGGGFGDVSCTAAHMPGPALFARSAGTSDEGLGLGSLITPVGLDAPVARDMAFPMDEEPAQNASATPDLLSAPYAITRIEPIARLTFDSNGASQGMGTGSGNGARQVAAAAPSALPAAHSPDFTPLTPLSYAAFPPPTAMDDLPSPVYDGGCHFSMDY